MSRCGCWNRCDRATRPSRTGSRQSRRPPLVTGRGRRVAPRWLLLNQRRNRDRLGCSSYTSHPLRKTTVTALDVSGTSARAIAEYLGHSKPSLTQDVYMSCNIGSAAAADHLDRMFGVSSGLAPAPERKVPLDQESGAPSRTRTCNLRIRRPLLYPLSYRGRCGRWTSVRRRGSGPVSTHPGREVRPEVRGTDRKSPRRVRSGGPGPRPGCRGRARTRPTPGEAS